MQLLYGVPEDIENWMSLVTQVRWNFPGLETQEKLKKAYSGAKRLQSMLLCVVGGRVWMVWWRVVPREMAKIKC